MSSPTTRQSRTVVVRLYAEETRRFHSDVALEVPAEMTDEQIERLPLRTFDGGADVDWEYECSSGIWPGNCGRRHQPRVREHSAEESPPKARIIRTPRGTFVLEAAIPTSIDDGSGPPGECH